MASVIAAVRRLARRLARIRYRLLLINVIVAAVPLVGITFAQMHEQQLLASLEDDMVHQGQLVRALIGARGAQDPAVARALVIAARDTRTRIRLLDARGAVLADSQVGAPQEASLAARREVRAALAGRYGSATRIAEGNGHVDLFAALPLAGGGVVYVTRSTHEVKHQLYRLRAWLARLLVATLVMTALISLVLATTIARPLGQLTRRAQRIAARQDVGDARRLTRRADEIGQLARAVEAMTAELERRARDARTLAADISHEFKTPLTGIRGAAELLRDGAADDPEARERFLAMIVEDTARLDRLVSRLLELARVEDDRGTATRVDLGELARATARRSWAVPVRVAVEGDVALRGRGAALASAIENLVANAVPHADAGSSVQVLVERRGAAIHVVVANRGPALSATARAKVWDRFYSTRTAHGGTGLGLAIVRSAALAHGGRVGVDCADGLTAFWFAVLAA